MRDLFILYEDSKVIEMTLTDMMCKRALQLGGIHIHQLFKLPTEDNLTPHRRAELEILNLMNNLKKINSLISVDVLAFDEIVQFLAETLSLFDIILGKIRNIKIYMDGVLIIFSMDHT